MGCRSTAGCGSKSVASSAGKPNNDEVGQLDANLFGLSRGTAATRLELGRLLDQLQIARGFTRLGFPTLRAYAVQRCPQGARWAHEARMLARRLTQDPGLPVLAGALLRQEVSTSMATVAAQFLHWFARREGVDREALAARERRVVDLARTRSVRAMRELLHDQRTIIGSEAGEREENPAPEADNAGPPSELSYVLVEDERPHRRLERTMPMHEVWLLEAARNYLGAVMGEDVSDETFLDALTSGVYDQVHAGHPRIDALMVKLDELHVRRARSELERLLRIWQRDDEERLAEPSIDAERKLRDRSTSNHASNDRVESASGSGFEPVEWTPLPKDPREIDARVVELSRHITRAELDMSVLVHRFVRARGWARLRYASQAHYARERLGLTRQAFFELRRRGRVLHDFPELFAAVESRHIGMVAATLIAKVAAPDTVGVWIERARRRTVLVLRQEVEAVEMAVRCGLDADPELGVDLGPPSEALLAEVADFERSMLDGSVWGDLVDDFMARAANGQSTAAGQDSEDVRTSGHAGASDEPRDVRMSEDLEEVAPEAGLDHDVANSDGASFDSPGVTVHFIVPEDAADAFEDAEHLDAFARELDAAEQGRPAGRAGLTALSLLGRLSLLLLGSLQVEPTLLEGKWNHIYLRDRYRCQSPVCGTRKTVTPHHMKFQSHGGGHEDDNLVTLCPTCHLEMVHEQRSLVVEPPASNGDGKIRWRVGGRDDALVEVVGRERVRG